MIHPSEVVIGVIAGIILMVAGLVPGLLQDFAQAISNFADSSGSRIEFGQPRWFATVGLSLICPTLLAYFWS